MIPNLHVGRGIHRGPLTPGTTEVIDVRCVEQDRWHGTARQVAGTPMGRRVRARRHRPARGVGDGSPPSGPATGARPTSPVCTRCRPVRGVDRDGGVPILLELSRPAHAGLVAHLDAAARDAAGRPPTGTTAHSARRFIGLVDQLGPVPVAGGGVGTALHGRFGPLEFRGIGDGTRLVHVSVFNKLIDKQGPPHDQNTRLAGPRGGRAARQRGRRRARRRLRVHLPGRRCRRSP